MQPFLAAALHLTLLDQSVTGRHSWLWIYRVVLDTSRPWPTTCRWQNHQCNECYSYPILVQLSLAPTLKIWVYHVWTKFLTIADAPKWGSLLTATPILQHGRFNHFWSQLPHEAPIALAPTILQHGREMAHHPFGSKAFASQTKWAVKLGVSSPQSIIVLLQRRVSLWFNTELYNTVLNIIFLQCTSCVVYRTVDMMHHTVHGLYDTAVLQI